MFRLLAAILSIAAWIPFASAGYSDTIRLADAGDVCIKYTRKFDPLLHKPRYVVGIYSSEGEAEVFRLYNTTFAQYLTATAGRRFNPPIQFDIVPVTLTSLMAKTEKEEVDFFFSSSAIFSCMATEKKAQPLVTVINRREARGHTFELDVYGGVMFTLADNDRVNSVEDFRGKSIGAGSITAMGAGQTQFYELFRAGVSYVADPLQVVFTNDERKIVGGVMNGDFEIGFARTDQIERTTDANGEPIDPDMFKVINPQIHVLDDGRLFPFLSSTDLHPEWPTSALDHVSSDVSEEVQDALLALRDHAMAQELNQKLRCDTTEELTELALAARSSGALVGFRTARSYFSVRTKQEATGLIRKNEKDELRCIRGDTLYRDIHCPGGQYKLPEEEFHKSCVLAGLDCKEGYDCYCKPCVKAFEVDVFQVSEDSTATEGCEKMSLCGMIEQEKTVHFQLVDHRERENPQIDVEIHFDFETVHIDVEPHPSEPYRYTFQWSHAYTGIGILNIHFDQEQIPQSPVRVQIIDRMCDVDFPGQRMTNTADGDCTCDDGSMEIRGRCVESTIIAVTASVLSVFITLLAGVAYMSYRTHKSDEIWHVSIDELVFDDPPEVIGEGSFGVVLLAQYRGTKVALKRALRVQKGSSRGTKRSRTKGATKRSHSSGSDTRNNTDSVGMSSVGICSDHSAEGQQTDDVPQMEEEYPDEESSGSRATTSSGGRHWEQYSLGFLAEDFGPRQRWVWLFPWLKRNSYKYRFKEAIFGGKEGSSHGKTWHARLCPWFDAHVRAEEDFMAEMRILSRLRHPCVTTVLGAVVSSSHDPMLVMEYMEYGSLHDLLRNETMHLSGEIILQIGRDIAQGLRFLHSSRTPIHHGDLKGRNILIDSRFRAKLCDFGLSVKKDNRITGTPFWLAPEYLRGQTQYNSMCDIFSMGIVLYEIYARSDPYKGEDFRDTLRKVCDRRVNKRPGIPGICPPKLADLMKKCWNPDPFFRPTSKDLDSALLDMNMRDAEPLTTEEQLQNKARKERATGDMLYELFPRHVADQLKAGQKVEPEQHEEVTVVFSDIVHFTDISRALSPLKVSQMLDRLYLAFDKVAGTNHVFKVETIGDAYMGVTNLDHSQMDTHVKNAALFAIDLVNEASKILIDEEDPSKGYINIRVGFHSGPVVSNVIGSLNPRYGLFGDTVNTSSRMESNSKPNRILCSEVSYKLLAEQAPELSVRKRSKIAVKGKGDMTVYWVGDREIDVTNDAGQLQSSADAKRVDFADTGADEEGSRNSSDNQQVDDHLWRRDLQSRLSDLDDDQGEQKANHHTHRVLRERAPPPSRKNTMHKRSSVKDPVRRSRRSTSH